MENIIDMFGIQILEHDGFVDPFDDGTQYRVKRWILEDMKKYAEKTFKCFVYGKGKLGDNYIAARTDGNLIIEFEGDENLIGTFQNIKVTKPLTYVLKGEIERN